MMLFLYKLLTNLGEPLIRLYLLYRRLHGKEPNKRFRERLGIANKERPSGFLIWLHGASVGEAISMLPVINQLKIEYPIANFLVTTGTVTSSKILQSKLPNGIIHQFIPVDRLFGVQRFLDHWNPEIALWWESEFWPNLITEAKARDVKMVLVNGRISIRSFLNWKRFPGVIQTILSAFSLCLAQSSEDAGRLIELGAIKAEYLGNLKLASSRLPVDEEAFNNLKKTCEGRPLWLAASTHPGEEMIAWQVHTRVVAKFPNLLTLIVPRHPERGARIAQELIEQGAEVALRSRNEKITSTTDIYLADTLGELGVFFQLCPIVFMGKSILGKGGQNPIEPARFGCTVLAGPHMENFSDIIFQMKESSPVQEVTDAKSLANCVNQLLLRTKKRRTINFDDKLSLLSEAEIIENLMVRLRPIIEQSRATGI